MNVQGRSCKQICWPPGVGGLQRVGLDPGQYDHHPHGVVHVGQQQDVQTVVPFIQEAHLRLITVSSSVMQFCKLLLFSTQESGVKSWGEPLPTLHLTSPLNINNHLLNSTFHIWTSHHFLIYNIHNTHFISSLQAAPADQHLTKPGNRHIYR